MCDFLPHFVNIPLNTHAHNNVCEHTFKMCESLLAFIEIFFYYLFTVLQCFDTWLGGRKGIRPVKTEWWGARVVVCLEQGADLHMAQLMTMPLTVSCFSKIQIGFTFLVPAHLGSPGKRAVKWVCVYLFTVHFMRIVGNCRIRNQRS